MPVERMSNGSSSVTVSRLLSRHGCENILPSLAMVAGHQRSVAAAAAAATAAAAAAAAAAAQAVDAVILQLQQAPSPESRLHCATRISSDQYNSHAAL